jgi:hypothetical protein
VGSFIPSPGQPVTGPDKSFKSGGTPSVVTFGFDQVGPPSNLYVQRDDTLLISILNKVPGLVLNVAYRLLLPYGPAAGQPVPSGAIMESFQPIAGGTIVRGITTFNPTSDNTRNNFIVTLAEGYLLGLVVTTTGAGPITGQAYVEALLFQGPPITGTGFNAQMLLEGYLPSFGHLGWPDTGQNPIGGGPGWIHSVQQANPGAGVDWIITVPLTTRWQLMSLQAQLAVANSGAARPVEIIIDDGANIVARMATTAAAAINATSNVNFSNSGETSTAIVGDLYAQMPSSLVLPQNFRIRSNTTNIVAGDQWSNIWFLVQEWIAQ